LARIHPRTKNEEVHAIIHPDFERMDEAALERGGALDEKGIRELLESHVERVNAVLAEYKRINSFSIREEEFPKTTTQKIKRYLFGRIRYCSDGLRRREALSESIPCSTGNV